MYWANFLHIYQPPTQSESILGKVATECYRPLVKILKENKSAKVTLNINACLTEQLARNGYSDVLEGLGQLAQEGRVELTGSAKYHPILPLIPLQEMERQIELNQKSNEAYFKGVWHPKGFFPPEMCYSKKVALTVKSMGFEWIILDEIAYDGCLGHYQNDRLYFIGSLFPLRIFFKERKISSAICFGRCRDESAFERLLHDDIDRDVYLITGTDGEIYGHHLPGQENMLQDVYRHNRIKTCTISELIDLFVNIQSVEPLDSSWSAWEEDIKNGTPYPQWDHPTNEIQQLLWELARLAIEQVHIMKISYSYTTTWQMARHLIDEGLHSCPWWWSSCRPWWGTQIPKAGVEILWKVFEMLQQLQGDAEAFNKAFLIKQEILSKLYDYDSSGKASALQHRYMQAHPTVSNMLSFGRESG